MPNDGARDVPDVSLAASGAHDGYMMYEGGTMYSVGGTSAASPSFAGIVTLLNQYLVSKGINAKPDSATSIRPFTACSVDQQRLP